MMDSLIHVNQASAGRDDQPPQLQISPHMDPDLYKAASEGNFDAFYNHLNHLDLLLTPKNNTILHVYITAHTKVKLNNDSEELIQKNRSSRILFLERVLYQCPSLLTKPNIKDATPLHIAARYGHYDIILVLAAHVYARISRCDQDNDSAVLSNFWRMITKTKETALHEAARNNHLQVVELLLEKDPELVNMWNDDGETPLYIAMERGYREVSSMILRSRSSSAAAYYGPSKRTVLHAAVIRKDAVMTEKILETTLGLTGRVDEEGWTPLHYASFFSSLEIAKLLLKFDKSAAYIQDLEGRTPLLVAATPRRHPDCLILCAEVMKLIISECPDCSELVDSSGRNVLHLAAESFNDPAMSALLQDHCLFDLINEKDNEGNTPFHVLANVGFNCKYLVRHHLLDSMAVNNRGFTAVDTIERSEFEDHIDKLPLKFNIKKVDKYWGSWRRKLHMEPLDNVKRRIDKMVKEIKENKDSHLVVATLIATVTFAAGFTLPGGLQNDDPKDPHDPVKKGYAVLSKRFAFKLFLITDSITFLASMFVILMHFLSAGQGSKLKMYWLCRMNLEILPCALFTIAVAFSAAIGVVLPHSYTVATVNFIITAIAIAIGLIIMQAGLYKYQVRMEDSIIRGSFWSFLLMDSPLLRMMGRISSFFSRMRNKFF